MTESQIAELESKIQAKCTVRRHIHDPEAFAGVKPQRSVLRNCEVCTKEFRVKMFRVKKGEGRFCSTACSNRSRTLAWRQR